MSPMPIFSKLRIEGKRQFGVQAWLFNGAVHDCSDGKAVKKYSSNNSEAVFLLQLWQHILLQEIPGAGGIQCQTDLHFPIRSPFAYLLFSPSRRAKDCQMIKGCYNNNNNKKARQVKTKRIHWPSGFASSSSAGSGDLGAHRSASCFLYPAEKAERLQQRGRERKLLHLVLQ